jgi:RND superfamily putative drug exporter
VPGFGVGLGALERLVPEVGTVPGSESLRADERLEDTTAEAETLTAVISGRQAGDPSLRASVAQAVAEVRAVPEVAAVSEPLPSTETGQALVVKVTLPRPQPARRLLTPGRQLGEPACGPRPPATTR